MVPSALPMLRRHRAHLRTTIAAAVVLAPLVLAALPATGAAADAPLLYLMKEPAAAAHDALNGPTLRQAPLTPDGRWPSARVVGKVRGRDLAGQSAGRIASMLRAGWRQQHVGGLVAVDEITPKQWTATSASALAQALDQLGGDARRVIFYAAPSFVERVGRADPRAALPAPLGQLIDAVSRGRATYLLTYRGDMSPFPAREMAMHPTRWAARWPAGRGELRAMLGPDAGAGQAEIWARLRATVAGRTLLANGPAAYGLTTPATARQWVAQYRAFRAAPSVSVTGADYPVPMPGGLSLAAAGTNRVKVRIDRPGRAVLTMKPVAGGGLRAIRKLAGPTGGDVVVRLPTDTRPGRYRVQAVLIGDGLKDRAAVVVRVKR
jgi:hypothetical protein